MADAPTPITTTIFCPKCQKTLDFKNFYTHKDGTKCDMCKKCQTMHIDNYKPDTFMWLLKDMDVPYISQEWNTLRDRAYAKNPHAMTGMSVYGKYLSKMKLKQWMKYTFADTERLQAEKDMKMGVAADEGRIQNSDILKEMFDEGKISEAEYKTLTAEPDVQPPAAEFYPEGNPYEVVEIYDVGLDLEEEDKIFLAMKWGRLYQPAEWVALEQFYNDMLNSFDVQGAARDDTLKKICKTSLKMDQAIDCGDTDTFQKLSRVYDVLMKSGKFTEAQNKEDGKGFVNSVGELVALCEREEGFIPRFDIEIPQDIVDQTIKDMNRYTYNLVTKDMGLGQQIEDAIKKIQIQREMEEEEDTLTDIEDIEQAVLHDIDMVEYYDEIESQKDEDFKLPPELTEEGEE